MAKRGATGLLGTHLQVDALKCPRGKRRRFWGDGGGLYLVTRDNGTKSWVFMWRRGKRGAPRQEWWLGAFPDLGVGDARDLAAKARAWLAKGLDPRMEREKEELANQPRPERSFGVVAERLIESRSAKWRNPKHKHHWFTTLLGHSPPSAKHPEGKPAKFDYCRELRPKPVAEITTEDVLAVIEPHWNTKTETMSRLRARIERVLASAKSLGWRTGDNVAAWEGHLENILTEKGEIAPVEHHRAMPFKPTRKEKRTVPYFVAQLRTEDSISAMAMEFLILTVGRSNEVASARWDEIDWEEREWEVPLERMKGRREHIVALSTRALAILKQLHERRVNDFIFPGQKRGRPISSAAFEVVLERFGVDDIATTHGFRSSFRDWCDEPEVGFLPDLCEFALAHKLPNKTERSYRRGTGVKARHRLMAAWAKHCDSYNVVDLRKRARA